MYAFPYLSRLIGTEMFSRLVAMMPPPLDASPEGRRDRDIVAMAMLKQMGPLRSVEEASLAITIVAADAHAHDALRGASESAGNLTLVMQCRAQANAMMRTRHKAAAELEALMRSRIAAERYADVGPETGMDDATEQRMVAAESDAAIEPEAHPEPVAEPPASPPLSPEPNPEPVPHMATTDQIRLVVTNQNHQIVSKVRPALAIVPPRVQPASLLHTGQH